MRVSVRASSRARIRGGGIVIAIAVLLVVVLIAIVTITTNLRREAANREAESEHGLSASASALGGLDGYENMFDENGDAVPDRAPKLAPTDPGSVPFKDLRPTKKSGDKESSGAGKGATPPDARNAAPIEPPAPEGAAPGDPESADAREWTAGGDDLVASPSSREGAPVVRTASADNEPINRLSPPLFSMGAGEFSTTAESHQLSLSDSNPSENSRIRYSLNSGPWEIYPGGLITVPAGAQIVAYCESINQDWLDSPEEVRSYSTEPRKLLEPVVYTSAQGFDGNTSQSIMVAINNPNKFAVSALEYRINQGEWRHYRQPFRLAGVEYSASGVEIEARAVPTVDYHAQSSVVSSRVTSSEETRASGTIARNGSNQLPVVRAVPPAEPPLPTRSEATLNATGSNTGAGIIAVKPAVIAEAVPATVPESLRVLAMSTPARKSEPDRRETTEAAAEGGEKKLQTGKKDQVAPTPTPPAAEPAEPAEAQPVEDLEMWNGEFVHSKTLLPMEAPLLTENASRKTFDSAEGRSTAAANAERPAASATPAAAVAAPAERVKEHPATKAIVSPVENSVPALGAERRPEPAPELAAAPKEMPIVIAKAVGIPELAPAGAKEKPGTPLANERVVKTVSGSIPLPATGETDITPAGTAPEKETPLAKSEGVSAVAKESGLFSSAVPVNHDRFDVPGYVEKPGDDYLGLSRGERFLEKVLGFYRGRKGGRKEGTTANAGDEPTDLRLQIQEPAEEKFRFMLGTDPALDASEEFENHAGEQSDASGSSSRIPLSHSRARKDGSIPRLILESAVLSDAEVRDLNSEQVFQTMRVQASSPGVKQRDFMPLLQGRY